MTEMNKINEDLSALMDGELDPAKVDKVLAALAQNPQLLADWQAWQCVGDVLRQESLGSSDFVARFSARLANEPVPLATRRRRTMLRRALLPLTIAASVSFVAVTAWQGFVVYGDSGQSVELAQMNEPKLRAYMQAHREDADDPLVERDLVAVSFEPGKNR